MPTAGPGTQRGNDRASRCAARLAELDDAAVVAAEESITIDLDGETHEIPIEDLDVRMDSAEG